MLNFDYNCDINIISVFTLKLNQMARGIVINSGTGGGGKLLITSFESKYYKTGLEPGAGEIDFTSSVQVAEGYLVDGTITPGTNVFTVNSVLNSTPTIITNNASGQVTIGADQVYYVKSTGSITGNVSVNGGLLIVSGGAANGNISIGANSSIVGYSGATIGGGTFEIQGGGRNAVVALASCTVNGKFSTAGITFVNLGGNNFNGNVTSKGDEYVIIDGNTIGGNKNLSVTDVVDQCSVKNNTVSGSTTLGPNCQA